MKKLLFSILAVAAMSVACTQFEEDTVPTYGTVGNPTVTANVVSDTEITVTVTAGENTSYYGYAVVKGTINATADALVADGYKKNAAVVLQGEDNAPQAAQVTYSEETKSVTLNLTDLVPYTDYTVYAAAVNTMGVVSEVISATVKTTDGTEPVVNVSGADFEEADSVLTFAIPFSDPVALTGTGTATAYFYAENYTDEYDYLVVYKTVDIPADHMATSGKYLLLAVPAEEYIPGAYVSMTYSADIVVNGAGAKNVAFDKNLMAYIEGELLWNGIVGNYDYVNWDFSLVDPATLPDEDEESGIEGEDDEEEEEEKVPVYFQDWTQLVIPTWGTTEYGIVTDTDDTEIKVTVVEMSGKTVMYTAKEGTFAAIGENVVGLMLNEDPQFGSSISYSIAEGSFEDLFGNVNNGFTAEDEYYCSYGYTVEDVIGEYTISGNNLWTGAVLSYPMEIEVSDAPEKGNVVITNYFGIEGSLYCDFNVHAGTLTIPEGRIFADGYASWFNGAGNQVFDFVPGQLSSATAYVMLVTVEGSSISGFAQDAAGNNIGLANFVATLNE